MDRPRLLLISACYVAGENRKKLAALAEHFELTCVTSTVVNAFGRTFRIDDVQEERAYRLIGLEPLGEAIGTTKYLLRGLGAVIRQHPADLIVVEGEPWALIRWQAWQASRLHQPEALFGEYAAETLPRHGLKGLVLSWIYRAAVATSHFTIGISERTTALFARAGAPASRLLASPNLGVDELHFAPAPTAAIPQLRDQLGLPREAFLVGFCGSFVPQKGVLDLVQAVEKARQESGRNLALALLGNGPLLAELQALQMRRSWLHLLPSRDHAEIAEFMQALDCFVLPSKPLNTRGALWEEQLGHVLLEAMACGTPCLGSSSGSIPALIGDGQLVFAHGDVNALADLLRRAVERKIDLAAVAGRQRMEVLARFSNSSVARAWADFMKVQLKGSGESPLKWVLLADQLVLGRDAGPRRFMDPPEHGFGAEFVRCGMIEADSEEEMQGRLTWLKTIGRRRVFFGIAGLLNVILHLRVLSRADVIHCASPHNLWWLAAFDRYRIFPARTRLIFGVFFRSNSFARRLPAWKRSPRNFHAFFSSEEQIEALAAAGCPRERLGYFPCRVDTEWYQPPQSHPRGDYILVPGSIHRDEDLVLKLAPLVPLPIIRVGQMGALRDKYAGQKVELRFNVTTREYLDLLQNAALVVLPIEPCDEPAGLTASMEALACETPLLSNVSLGVGPLLKKAYGIEPIPDLQPETWATAVQETLAGRRIPTELSKRGREYILAEHSIPSDRSHWKVAVEEWRRLQQS